MRPDYSPPKPESLLFIRQEICYAPIVPLEGATNLNCYFNARNAAKKHGGAIVDIWEVAEVPGYFLHFRPHVIWKKECGEIVDPTPSEFGFSLTTYFESKSPHNLPMPAGYLYPLSNHPFIVLNCKIQNIAYKFISQKLSVEKPTAISRSQLIAECTKRLEDENLYSSDNMDLLLNYILRDIKTVPLSNDGT